jgi:hypothetical protein
MSMMQPLYTVTVLQALAQVLAPAARAEQNGSHIEIHVAGAYIGRIEIDGPDQWFAKTLKSEADPRRASRMSYEETTGPFRTPAECIRSMFGGRHRSSVKVTGGICGDDQQGSFENATMQTAGDYLSFSVKTTLAVPDSVANESEKAAARYIESMLDRASSLVPGLSFEVQIGPNEAEEH